MNSAAKYWLLLACMLATLYGTFLAWRRSQGEASAIHTGTPAPVAAPVKTSDEPRLDHFVLTDQSGQPFDSESLRGKVWVGSFFFTNCPAICWRLNQALAALQETSPTSAAHFVSITCDPENDTPPALAKYAQHFKADPARWTFLTGEFNLIRRIGNEMFQVAVEKETHSDRAFVVDRTGHVRGRFRLTEPDQVEMLRKLLAVVEAEPLEAQPESGHASNEEKKTAALGMSLRLELFVSDLERSIGFYTSVLGFDRMAGSADYAPVSSGSVVIGLGPASKLSPRHYFNPELKTLRRGLGTEIVLEVDDIQAAYNQAKASGYKNILSPPRKQSWGATDFRIADPDGYYLRITSR